MIDQNNYTYCCYTNNSYKAIISIGMDPESIDKLDYYVTVVQDENLEIAQKNFDCIDTACNYINKKYSDIWKFNNLTIKSADASGCSTCVAH